MFLSSYHYLVWLALIGNNSILLSFSTTSEFNIKSKQTNSKKLLSSNASPFLSSSLQRPQNNSLMDWSLDISKVQASLQPHIPLVRECISLPYVLLPNRDLSRKSRVESNDSSPSVLNYSNNQLSIASFWNGVHHTLSIFGTEETIAIDAANISLLITRIIDYIKYNLADKKPPAREFTNIVRAFWSLIVSLYSSR